MPKCNVKHCPVPAGERTVVHHSHPQSDVVLEDNVNALGKSNASLKLSDVLEKQSDSNDEITSAQDHPEARAAPKENAVQSGLRRRRQPGWLATNEIGLFVVIHGMVLSVKVSAAVHPACRATSLSCPMRPWRRPSLPVEGHGVEASTPA